MVYVIIVIVILILIYRKLDIHIDKLNDGNYYIWYTDFKTKERKWISLKNIN